MKRTYRQDRETGKLYEVTPGTTRRGFVGTDEVSPFVSPVDGSVIRTRKQLEEHNRRNGVSNDPDHLREQVERARDRPLPKTERVRELIKSYDFVQQNQHLFRR